MGWSPVDDLSWHSFIQFGELNDAEFSPTTAQTLGPSSSLPPATLLSTDHRSVKPSDDSDAKYPRILMSKVYGTSGALSCSELVAGAPQDLVDWCQRVRSEVSQSNVDTHSGPSLNTDARTVGSSTKRPRHREPSTTGSDRLMNAHHYASSPVHQPFLDYPGPHAETHRTALPIQQRPPDAPTEANPTWTDYSSAATAPNVQQRHEYPPHHRQQKRRRSTVESAHRTPPTLHHSLAPAPVLHQSPLPVPPGLPHPARQLTEPSDFVYPLSAASYLRYSFDPAAQTPVFDYNHYFNALHFLHHQQPPLDSTTRNPVPKLSERAVKQRFTQLTLLALKDLNAMPMLHIDSTTSASATDGQPALDAIKDRTVANLEDLILFYEAVAGRRNSALLFSYDSDIDSTALGATVCNCPGTMAPKEVRLQVLYSPADPAPDFRQIWMTILGSGPCQQLRYFDMDRFPLEFFVTTLANVQAQLSIYYQH
ncbi:hypothetical protein IWQ60_007794 [Tieghemiomyces parasiticus]|uniref:Uncharacterized protein n=1 Tax=Tieghemiomyces parasiticus TaxID=78921 RepID=A0A9W8DSY9_9FUNG|nr:hypothetical protein IWQ60_007794 [Tieghemiomyces parasiticus]